jgi:23S rRNA (adenine2503-C2)-methyltransferase
VTGPGAPEGGGAGAPEEAGAGAPNNTGAGAGENTGAKESAGPAKARLLDLQPGELKEFAAGLGEKPFRGRQLARWLFQKGAKSFSEMTDMPLSARRLFAAHAEIGPKTAAAPGAPTEDGAIKIINTFPFGERAESVLISEDRRQTLCVSSQAGCALGCLFCRTGSMGLKRSLTQGEILGQILAAQKISPAPITNLVFMGMGEPLQNQENLHRALRIILDPEYLAFSHKRVTVSTVGLMPGLEKFGAEFSRASLTISLNAAAQELRDHLMPGASRLPLADLKEALKRWPLPQNRRITLAWVLLKGVNHRPEDARALTRFASGLRVKINLIPFNPWPGAPFARPADDECEEFRMRLVDKHFTALIRRSRGGGAGGACGQLALEGAQGGGGWRV